MIKKCLICLFSALYLSFVSYAQIKIGTNGNVGIGTNNTDYQLSVYIGESDKMHFQSWTSSYIDQTGLYGATCFYPNNSYYVQLGKSDKRVGKLWSCEIDCLWNLNMGSDIRYKENIAKIDNPLEKLKLVNGIKYNLREDLLEEMPDEIKNKYTEPDFGFIAQDLKEVFPELVVADTNGYLSVKYLRMIPILVEAIKEQQTQIEYLQEIISNIQEQDQNPPDNFKTVKEQNNGENYENANINRLQVFQNRPNPFYENTIIQSYIPNNYLSVKLCFYDLRGTLIKCIDISQRGDVYTEINGGELNAGIYIYLLQGDGVTSEAKQMILTK